MGETSVGGLQDEKQWQEETTRSWVRVIPDPGPAIRPSVEIWMDHPLRLRLPLPTATLERASAHAQIKRTREFSPLRASEPTCPRAPRRPGHEVGHAPASGVNVNQPEGVSEVQ